MSAGTFFCKKANLWCVDPFIPEECEHCLNQKKTLGGDASCTPTQD
jgi:hypothetical protein